MKAHSLLLCLTLALSGAVTAFAQTAISPAASPTPAVNAAAAPEGFIMIGGKVHVVRQGQAIPLDREMTLRVGPAGIIGFDQVPRTLTNDNMLTMDGRVVAAPSGLIVAPPPPQISPEAARNLDPGVSGENISGLAPARVTSRPAAPPPSPPLRTTTTVTTPTVTVPTPAAVAPATPAPRPGVTANPNPAPSAPAATVFDPNVVNDGSIEAAGTGTRRPVQ